MFFKILGALMYYGAFKTKNKLESIYDNIIFLIKKEKRWEDQ